MTDAVVTEAKPATLGSEHVRITDEAGVRSMILNRPEKKNALTQPMYHALADAMANADTNPDVRVLFLTGAGGDFTAGNDLGDFAAAGAQRDHHALPGVSRFLDALVHTKTPMVVAVKGVTVGIGVTLLLHADLVYAADDARLRTPFVDLGLVPEAGSSILLPAVIGRARANEMLLLGEPIGAQEACDAGLVARVFPADRVEAEARERAARLAAKAPRAVRESKRLLSPDTDPLVARMAEESGLFARLLQSEEFKEAATAFMEKRAPDFSRFS